MDITHRRITKLSVLLLLVVSLLLTATDVQAQAPGHFSRPTTPDTTGVIDAVNAEAPQEEAATLASPVLERAAQAVPVAAPSSPAIPASAVRIPVGSDASAIVAANPPGTTFAFAAGVHRGVQITVRNGDTYLGEPGAILDGTRLLDTSAAQPVGGAYQLTGVTMQARPGPSTSCAPWDQGGLAICGHEHEVARSEMLLIDGRRLRHVNGPQLVDANSWHFDPTIGTVTIGQLGGTVEMAVHEYAFEAWSSRDVTIAGLHIRNYASRVQMGAIDALGTDGWVIDGVAVTGSHGYGIRVGRDITITNSLVADNGHLGIGGPADYHGVTITGNEIAGNGWLGVQPGFESGGLKVVYATGVDITHNWVHDNAAKGIWVDCYVSDAVVAFNRVERSGQTGILYEISSDAVIHDNVLLDNHTGEDTSESYGNLQIVDSRDVVVRDNLLRGGGAQELTIYAADREPGVANVVVRDNNITVDTTWDEGTYGLKDLRSDKSTAIPGIEFTGNVVRIISAPGWPVAWDQRLISFEEWSRVHPGDHIVWG